MFILFWCFWPLYSLIRPYEFLTNLLMYVLFLNQKISNLSDCDYQRSNQHWCSLMRHETFAMFSIYIMWDASRRQRDHTLRTLPAIHLIASSCLLGWTTSTSSRPSWHPRMFNVCRILLPLSIAWTVSSSDSVNSNLLEVLARHGWSLPVSLHRFPTCYATQPSLSSWEYLTTLDYEWRVIRGHLPYWWMIWVHNDGHFTFVSPAMLCPWADLHLW